MDRKTRNGVRKGGGESRASGREGGEAHRGNEGLSKLCGQAGRCEF